MFLLKKYIKVVKNYLSEQSKIIIKKSLKQIDNKLIMYFKYKIINILII